jgi:hypothetical protein
MAKFEFISTSCPVTVGDQEFTLTVGDVEVIARMAVLRDESARRLEELGAGGEESAESLREACAMIGRQIDCLLGQGAYDRLFGGRPLNYLEHTELMVWLNERQAELMVERRRRILGPDADRPEAMAVTTTVIDARPGPDDPVQ